MTHQIFNAEQTRRNRIKINKLKALAIAIGLGLALMAGTLTGLSARPADRLEHQEAPHKRNISFSEVLNSIPQVLTYLERDEARELRRDQYMHRGF